MAPKYSLRRGLIAPSHKNRTTIRGGKAQEKDVLPCHALHDSALVGFPLWSSFEAQGWIDFLTRKTLVHKKLVKFFNKHVQFSSDAMFISCGKVLFEYSTQDFVNDFGLKDEGFSDYDMRTWPSDMNEVCYNDIVYALNRRSLYPAGHKGSYGAWKEFLSDEDYVMSKMIRDVVLHTSNSSSDLSKLETMVLYRLKFHLPINLPQLIICHIHSAIIRGNVNYYPLGILVCHIMQKWNILGPLSDEDGISPHIIGISTISKMGFELKNGVLVPKPSNKKRQRPNLQGGGSSGANVQHENEHASGLGFDSGGMDRLHEDIDMDALEFDDDDGMGMHGASGADAAARPPARLSVDERLTALELKIDEHHRQNQSCYFGLLNLLKCIGRKQGLSEAEMDAAAAPTSL